MKFAIYGDSFAESSPLYRPDPQLDQLSWATQLAQLNGATHCDYYAVSGSSFFYSYQKMLDTADQYQGIIVAVSDPNRYTREEHGHHFTGYIREITPDLKQRGFSKLRQNQINGWFASFDLEFMSTAQRLMVQDVQQRWPHAMIVPCFGNSFSGPLAEQWQNFNLFNITQIALQQMGMSYQYPGYDEINGVTGMMCHMPVEWQRPVAEMLDQFFKTSQLIIPKLQLLGTVDQYYQRR
jgi:hypothetical protein